MENITPTFVTYPTRVANMVHYLTYGKTLNPVVINLDKLEGLLKYLATQPNKGANWSKVK